MSEITKATLLFSTVGIMYISLGIPLLRGQVRPNFWYGCRTTKILSDEKIWYAVNRITGRHLIVGGILVLMSSLAVFLLGSLLNPTFVVPILVSVAILSVAGIVFNSLRTQRRM